MTSKNQVFEEDLALRLQELAIGLLDDMPKNGSLAPSLLITSARKGEGKTTLTLMLAKLMAHACGEPVLVVDANFRSPGLSTKLGLKASMGFSDELQPSSDVGTHPTVHEYEGGVFVISAGTRPDAILLSRTEALTRFRQRYSNQFRFIIFDGAIVRLGGSMLARRTDGVIMVIDSTETRREVVQGAIGAMRLPPGRLLGGILNKRMRHIPNFLYRAF